MSTWRQQVVITAMTYVRADRWGVIPGQVIGSDSVDGQVISPGLSLAQFPPHYIASLSPPYRPHISDIILTSINPMEIN